MCAISLIPGTAGTAGTARAWEKSVGSAHLCWLPSPVLVWHFFFSAPSLQHSLGSVQHARRLSFVGMLLRSLLAVGAFCSTIIIFRYFFVFFFVFFCFFSLIFCFFCFCLFAVFRFLFFCFGHSSRKVDTRRAWSFEVPTSIFKSSRRTTSKHRGAGGCSSTT